MIQIPLEKLKGRKKVATMMKLNVVSHFFRRAATGRSGLPRRSKVGSTCAASRAHGRHHGPRRYNSTEASKSAEEPLISTKLKLTIPQRYCRAPHLSPSRSETQSPSPVLPPWCLVLMLKLPGNSGIRVSIAPTRVLQVLCLL